MKEYTSYEIQDISSAFRNVARHLSRTDYSQCDANLKRFMAILEKEELISLYIAQYNTVPYDIPAILKARDWLDPFEISAVQEEEMSLCVQLLQHAVKTFDGDFTRLYGTHWYTSTKSTVEDEMRKFIEHVIDPLIDHIAEYLRHCYDEAVRKPNSYRDQNELRLAVGRLDMSRPTSNGKHELYQSTEPLKFEIGNISDITQIMSIDDFCTLKHMEPVILPMMDLRSDIFNSLVKETCERMSQFESRQQTFIFSI